jgi:hypothetical protein
LDLAIGGLMWRRSGLQSKGARLWRWRGPGDLAGWSGAPCHSGRPAMTTG